MTFLFGTVGAPISTPKKPGGSVSAIFEIIRLGLSALELGWVRSVNISESSCLNIHNAAEEHKIALSVHASYYININTDENSWPQHKQRLHKAVYFGSIAGATDIIFHPGSYMREESSKVLPVVSQRLNELQNDLIQEDISITLRPETMGKPSLIGSLDDLFEICAQVERCFPCLDFPHLFARTGGKKPVSVSDFIEILSCYESVFGKTSLQSLHIHVSGIDYTEAGEKKHLPLIESKFNYKALLSALHEKNCSGRILCESPEMERDAILLKEYWESLL